MSVRHLTRNRFRAMFRERWAADQHVSLIGPVGRGKTFTARQILEHRPGRVLVLAPKGPDPTLQGFGHHLKSWPPNPLTVKGPRSDGSWRLLLQPPLKRSEDFARMREHFAKALEATFRQGDWTVYTDELQVLADPRMMGLGKIVEQMLITGRSRKVAVVSSIQVPRWAPKAAFDQASHVLMWRQRDRPALKRISEISGVDNKEIEQLVSGLDFHSFVWVDAGADEYFVVSKD